MDVSSRTYLDVGTIHIHPSTAAWLSTQASVSAFRAPSIVVHEYIEGFFVPVIPDEVDDPVGMPADLSGVFALAKRKGADLIRFDRDTRACDELPRFDVAWEAEREELVG